VGNSCGYPLVNKAKDKIVVEFVPRDRLGLTSIEIPLVVDFDLNGDVIGIEALNLCFYAGRSIQGKGDRSGSESGRIRLTYDDEVDALYLRIDDGRSLRQRRVNGNLLIDADGRLIAIEASLDEHGS
jgi:uncharacterized protein YuzE